MLAEWLWNPKTNWKQVVLELGMMDVQDVSDEISSVQVHCKVRLISD